MLNLSKKAEYGLKALTYLSTMESGRLANVSEIARSTVIPKELLAKVLSALVKAGLAYSAPGPTGGFQLARPASSVSLAEVLRVLESRNGMTECASREGRCTHIDTCVIRQPMARVNQKVSRIFEETMLTDLIVDTKPKKNTPAKIG